MKTQEKIVYVTAAHSVDELTEQTLKRIFGKDVVIKTTVDKSILGGVRIKFEDKLFDGTLQNKLNQLRVTLNKHE